MLLQVHVKREREVEIVLPVEHVQNAEGEWITFVIIISYREPAASCELDKL